MQIIRLISRETDMFLLTFLFLLSDGEGHHAPIGGNEAGPSNMFQVENLSLKKQSLQDESRSAAALKPQVYPVISKHPPFKFFCRMVWPDSYRQ